MKKLLLIAAATAALSTSAMADESAASSTKTGFYVRGDVGAFLNTTQKLGTEDKIKSKSKAVPSIDVGIGYNVTSQFRAELVYTHLFNPQSKSSEAYNQAGYSFKSDQKCKGKVDALMINGIFDAYDFGTGKLFVGAGIGIAQVSEKVAVVLTEDGDVIIDDTVKLKKKNNFAYNLMVGSSFNLADGVNLDVQYRWADYGTAKYGKSDDDNDDQKLYRRGNAIKLGVRFDI